MSGVSKGMSSSDSNKFSATGKGNEFGISSISGGGSAELQGLMCFSACGSKCNSNCETGKCSAKCSSSCWSVCGGGADTLSESGITDVENIVL